MVEGFSLVVTRDLVIKVVKYFDTPYCRFFALKFTKSCVQVRARELVRFLFLCEIPS